MTSDLDPPGINPTLPPDFHNMGEYDFQRLVTDLLFYEADVVSSDEHGLRGNADDGADMLAPLRGGGQIAGSCKRYPTTSAGKIKDWSDEFLEHWDERWKMENIRRFVLATSATNVASAGVQQQIAVERRRFANLGVEYEVWSPVTLTNKLRPHRALAVNYLREDWAVRVCGPLVEPAATSAPVGTANLVSSALIGQLAALQERLSSQALEAAERAQEDLRAGRTALVRSFVEDQRREENWSQLDERARSRLLRLAASLALRDQDIDCASALSAEADAIAAQEEPRLAAHVALERAGPAAALSVLGEVETLAGLQLRVALKTMSGDMEGARLDLAALLAKDSADTETIRMEALVALASGEPSTALSHMRRVEALAPDWTAVLQLGAMARYACALSPALGPEFYLSPNAFDIAFVREDAESQALLGEALTLLDRLVDAEPFTMHHRVWRLAVLSSRLDERTRASEEAADLLVRSDHDPAVVAWCLMRGLDVDLAPSEASLTARYRAGGDATAVRVLALLLLRDREPLPVAALLKEHLDRQADDARAEADEWIRRLEGADGDAGAGLSDPSELALRSARDGGDWSAVAARLAALLASDRPDPGALALAEATAGLGRVDILAPYADALLRFATPTAVRLSAHALTRAGEPARAVAVIDAHAAKFGTDFPPDVRRLRAEALARAGDIPAAIREADRLAGSGEPVDRLFRAELVSSTGDVRAALPAVREALEAGLLTGDGAYRWSRIVRAEEPRLARRLLERAVSTDLGERFVTAAMHDAMGMKLDGHANALMARVQLRAEAGAPDVRILSLDDIPGLLADQRAQAEHLEGLLLDGAIPIHLAMAHDPVGLALLHLGPGRTPAGRIRPWLIRHGARPDAVVYDLPWSSWRLHLDVTALLIAERLQLLDILEAHPGGVSIPVDVPLLLLSMEDGCRARADSTLAQRILAANVRPDGVDGEPTTQVTADEEGVATPQRSRSITFAALVAELVGRMVVDEETAAALVDGLPPHENASMHVVEGPLLLDEASLRRLASHDVLMAAGILLDLRCDGTLLDAAVATCDAAAAASDAAARLAALRTRIAIGLATGAFRFLPNTPDQGSNDDQGDGDSEGAKTAVTRCLHDVIAAPAVENGIAWIDDRMITGFASTTTMPIIGVADALEAMLLEGLLTEAERSAKLAELRGAGALFMVPDAKTVAAALISAPRNGQKVIETPRLAGVRRSIALLALHEQNLAIGGTQPSDRPDEIVPMQTAMQLLVSCLKTVWLDKRLTFDDRIACSDWLWMNVRRSHVGLSLASEDRDARQAFFEASQIAHCFDQGTDIGLVDDRRKQVRLNYLQWVWWRMFAPLAQLDPTLIERISVYLADLYASLLREYDTREGLDRRTLLSLLARRIHRLPGPIQTKLYRDLRMRRFGATSDRITVGKVNLPLEGFWREVRRAVRYGSGRLQARDARGRRRLVRMRRDGSNVLLTGAVRARIGDGIIDAVAARVADRPSTIERFLAGLRLPPAEAERVRAEAAVERDPARLATTLRVARELSAAARHEDLFRRIARRESFKLDELAPAPFGSILSAIGIQSTNEPFGDALTAARLARDGDDPEAGLLETAGMPVLRTDLTAIDFEAWNRCARTPLALTHLLAAGVALRRPEREIRGLVDRLAVAVDSGGRLFTTLLRWTHRLLLRDAAWRAAPMAYALATLWGHADRVLDSAMRGGLLLDQLRKNLDQSLPEATGVDLLWLQSERAPDVAWPAWMSGPALLHHGLAAAFGETDLRTVVGDELMERLAEMQLARTDGVVGCEVRLLLRRNDWPNAMGSFLNGSPRGFDDLHFDRPTIRRQLVESALATVEADLEDQSGWLQLGAFASVGIDTDLEERFVEAVSDPLRLVRLTIAGLDRSIWRAVIQPLAWSTPNRASELAVEVARGCCRMVQVGTENAIAALRPDEVARELVEVASIVAACSGSGRARAFAEILDGFVQVWPDLRPVMHQTAGNLAATTPSARSGELWRLQNHLGAR